MTMTKQIHTTHIHIINSLCGFDNVPGAVVIHMVFAADILTVAVVVMTLGFDFLKRKRDDKRQKHRDKDKSVRLCCYIRSSALCWNTPRCTGWHMGCGCGGVGVVEVTRIQSSIVVYVIVSTILTYFLEIQLRNCVHKNPVSPITP